MDYQCKQGDVLDAICNAHYGAETGTTERVLEHNQGLADYDPHLPMGLIIQLPDIKQQEPVVTTTKLWD